MAKYVTAFAVSYFFLVELKDGTLPRLIQSGANFVSTGVSGLRPLTRVG
jgi:hypothetical protein